MATSGPEITPILSLLVLFFLFWLGFFFLPMFMLKRAMAQVVTIFRANHSLCSDEPKTPLELGLVPLPFYERMFRPRDYKPYALQVLVKAGVIRVRHDGKLCLVED